MEDLNAAQEKAGDRVTIRVMVDHAEQVALLATAAKRLGRSIPWSVFVKVNGGGNRAGAPPRSEQMKLLISALKDESAVEVYGFYSRKSLYYGRKEEADGETLGSLMPRKTSIRRESSTQGRLSA